MQDSNFRIYYRPESDPQTPVHMEFGPRGDYLSVKLGIKEFVEHTLMCRDVARKVAPELEQHV